MCGGMDPVFRRGHGVRRNSANIEPASNTD
jgi:hypothetical protein